jgi:hypothetical protein
LDPQLITLVPSASWKIFGVSARSASGFAADGMMFPFQMSPWTSWLTQTIWPVLAFRAMTASSRPGSAPVPAWK